MLQYHIFPGGKRRALTFSYGDGHQNDERLTALFAKYGIKGTFHLNSACLTAEPEVLRVSADETIIENPTATDVWVEKDKKEIYRIPAGKQVVLP